MPETPANTSQATAEALQTEVDRLRTKNTELLAELKAAKATATDAQTALAALQGERDAAQAEVRALRLDGPVAALLADVTIDAELFGQLFARHYKFALDEAGAVVILDAEGNPANVTEPDEVQTHGKRGHRDYREARTPGKTRPATFTAGDVRMLAEASPDAAKFNYLIANRASGGGATSAPYRGPMPASDNKPAPAAPAQPFGLR